MRRTLIIAEAGVNHNGDIGTAKELVWAAKECGADIIKFQTFHVNGLVSKCAEMAEYQKINLGVEKKQKEMLQKLALCDNDFLYLVEYCDKIGIKFLSAPFDIESIHFLNSLQNMWKIPSGEITDYPYLIEIARTEKEIIMSTGMSTLDEVGTALKILKENGAPGITLLHCTTEYPAVMKDVNLKAMLLLKERYGCDVGYSDHTPGIEIPIAAVAMGAAVVEKHFTLDRQMEGPDHKASLEPNELSLMVKAIRNVEDALGDGKKGPSKSEAENRAVVRKSIVALKKIKRGEIFSENNITTKRPGNGINPMRWPEVIGMRAIKDFQEDELIEI